MNWVLITKLSELTGYSKQAIYAKVKKGIWREGVHYRRQRGRLHFSLKAYEQWVEGKAV